MAAHACSLCWMQDRAHVLCALRMAFLHREVSNSIAGARATFQFLHELRMASPHPAIGGSTAWGSRT